VDPSNVRARLLETRSTLAAGGDQIREVSAAEAWEGPALAAVVVSGSESGESRMISTSSFRKKKSYPRLANLERRLFPQHYGRYRDRAIATGGRAVGSYVDGP
jgi:hypothetical protein